MTAPETPPCCPSCASPDVVWKAKARQYECRACELRFQATPTQSVFLSYAHKSDRADDYDQSEELVSLIHDQLVREGHQVFFDRHDIRSGDEWRARITDAILHHDVFFSFLSRRSVRDSGVCLNEINLAIANGKRVHTFLLESEEHTCPPLTVTHIQWQDMRAWRAKRASADWEPWFADQMAQIRRILADGQQARLVGELQTLRDILQPHTFEALVARKTLGFSGRQWLFDRYERWLASGSSRLFWIKGAPGIGKSAFAAALVSRAKTVVIGSYFCDFQALKPPEEAAKEAISTLAYQIASRLPDYRARLLFRDYIDQAKIGARNADELFQYLITEPLCRSAKIPEAYRMTLVIDGLDEAGRAAGGNVLADLLAKHADSLPDWLGLVITSRPEPYLARQFSQFSCHDVDSDTPDNLDDIRAYLHGAIDPQVEPQARRAVVETVLAKSEGIFLYARLLVDSAPDWRNPSALPTGLDGFYTASFKRYFPDVKEYAACQERFLDLLAAAPGALPRQLAQAVLEWNGAQLQRHVIEPLGALLVDTGAGLALFHKSLADWLVSPRRSGPYAVGGAGRRHLGAFLLDEIERYASSPWQYEVRMWFPLLAPHTPQWQAAPAMEMLAHWYAGLGWYETAIRFARRWCALQAEGNGEQSIEHARALAWLGHWLARGSDDQEALATLETAHAIYRAHLPQYWENAVSLLASLGCVSDKLGRHAQSVTYYREALALQRQADPHDVQAVDARLAELGAALVNVHALEEARAVFGALRGSEAERDHAIPQMIAQYTDAIGDYQGTCALLQESMRKLEARGGAEPAELAALMQAYAYSCIEVNEVAQAVAAAERAHRLRTLEVDPQDLRFARSMNLLASVFVKAHRYGDALELLADTLGRYQRLAQGQVIEAVASDMAHVQGLLGRVCVQRGRNADALEYLENALAILERLLPVEHEAFRTTSEQLVACLAILNRIEEADHRRERSGELLRSYGVA